MKNNRSSTTQKTEDVQGETCQLCGEESFRILPREIEIAPGKKIKVGCCPRCCKALDAGKEAEKEQKYKTRIEQQEASFQWANNLHGKKVFVLWPPDVFPRNPLSRLLDYYTNDRYAQGTAYRYNNAGGGWGQVKVILDPKENTRISMVCRHTTYCSVVKMDMHYMPASFVCDNTACKEQAPVIDKQRWGGLSLFPVGDGNYYTLVSWGDRKNIKAIADLRLEEEENKN